MTNFLSDLVNDERGHDTINGALIVGAVAVLGIAVCIGTGISLKGIWANSLGRLSEFPIPTD